MVSLKVCEYGAREEVKRMYSVAYVIRPKDKSACLCFSLMSKAPTRMPWHGDPDDKGPSRIVVLDLHDDSECYMQSVVEPKFLDLISVIEDDMQVQCLWLSQGIPDGCAGRCLLMGSHHGVGSPICSRIICVLKMLSMAGLVNTLRKEQIFNQGVLPPESSAQGRICVMWLLTTQSGQSLPKPAFSFKWVH